MVEESELELAEAYAKEYNWRKTKGYKMNIEHIREEYETIDNLYFEELDSFVESNIEYWTNDDSEAVFEELDEVIEQIEDNEAELTLKEWIASKKKEKFNANQKKLNEVTPNSSKD